MDVARTFSAQLHAASSAMLRGVKTARSAWKWTLGGQVRHGMVSVPRPAIPSCWLLNHPDAPLPYSQSSQRAMAGDSTFWVANGMAGKACRLLRFPRFVRARKRLLELKMLKQVSLPRSHSPVCLPSGERDFLAVLSSWPTSLERLTLCEI